MKKRTKDDAIELVAISAALVLFKYGSENPDWTEWRTLKDDLLKLQPHLGDYASRYVGSACSDFNVLLSNRLKTAKDRLKSSKKRD